MATDICLAVDKYSHAIGTRLSDGTVPWTHILASDLFVVVKGINTDFVDGMLTMQIIQGTKVLVCHKSLVRLRYISNLQTGEY